MPPPPSSTRLNNTTTTTTTANNAALGPWNVSFIHPDLGLGGAERLIVDAATGLQNRGHSVQIFTSHHDPTHCFPETNNGTLKVTVYGDFLPRSILNRFHLICALVRHLYLIICIIILAWTSSNQDPHVYILDQISLGIPLLQQCTSARILFYCHFPDKLLSIRSRQHTLFAYLKQIYRTPLDWVEEFTTRQADELVVNSKFTRAMFKASFPSIRTVPAIVYPGISIPPSQFSKLVLPPTVKSIFVSINRFEVKKNLHLAILAFSKANIKQSLLVLAGGYDLRVRENAQVLASLEKQCLELGLVHATLSIRDKSAVDPIELPSGNIQVVFIPSIPESAKYALLKAATCLLYTPSYEHFGIVPVEAMFSGVPVIAIGNGGPAESIIHQRTGYLCSAPMAPRPLGSRSRSSSPGSQWSDPEIDVESVLDSITCSENMNSPLVDAFCCGMHWVLALSASERSKLISDAKDRAQALFSHNAFLDALESALMSCMAGPIDRSIFMAPYVRGRPISISKCHFKAQ